MHVKVGCLESLELYSHRASSRGALEDFVLGEERFRSIDLLVSVLDPLLNDGLSVSSVGVPLHDYDDDDDHQSHGHIALEDGGLTLDKLEDRRVHGVVLVEDEHVESDKGKNESCPTIKIVARLLNLESGEDPVEVRGLLKDTLLLLLAVLNQVELSVELISKVTR